MVPAISTKSEFTGSALRTLAAEGVELNVTAIIMEDQVGIVTNALDATALAIVSVFTGRIADTGFHLLPSMRKSVEILQAKPKAVLLSASSCEVLNIFQADQIACHIITCGNDLIASWGGVGKDLVGSGMMRCRFFIAMLWHQGLRSERSRMLSDGAIAELLRG